MATSTNDFEAIKLYLGHTSSSESNHGPITEITETAQLCSRFKYLNGKDAESRALVWQWLENYVESEWGNTGKLIQNLNAELQDHVFVVGNDLTIADLVLYRAVKSVLHDMTHQEKQTRFMNVARWFDHIQELDGISLNEKRIVVLKNNVYLTNI